jgi:TonB family protein
MALFRFLCLCACITLAAQGPSARAIDEAKRALARSPDDPAIARRLGAEYAFAILGVTEVHGDTPMRAEPAEMNSALTQQARAELRSSRNAMVLDAAARVLLINAEFAGAAVLPLIDDLRRRAQAFDPSRPAWSPHLMRRLDLLTAHPPSPVLHPIRLRAAAEREPIESVAPKYPAPARQARIQGVVTFTAILARDGRVLTLTLISGHPLLAPAAREAVEQWRYTYTLADGVPAEVIMPIHVTFQLTE